jgi:hypothetical protein
VGPRESQSILSLPFLFLPDHTYMQKISLDLMRDATNYSTNNIDLEPYEISSQSRFAAYQLYNPGQVVEPQLSHLQNKNF